MKLLQDLIVIKKDLDYKTSGGVVMSENEVDLIQGEVLNIGEKVTKVKVGDKIVVSRYSYSELESSPETLYILKEDDVIGII